MLHCLEVHDFGHIAHAQLQLPDTGFCVITGETGMGKSMLVDALALALGNRTARKPVRSGAQQAEICAAFILPPSGLAAGLLAKYDLAGDGGELVIRRLIDKNARSKNYINGRFVSLVQLQEMAAGVMTICGQHAHLQLTKSSRRRQLLDAAANAADTSEQVASCYTAWQHQQRKLAELLSRQGESAQRIEQLEEQLAEIDLAQLNAEQLAANEALVTLRDNAEELGNCANALADDCAAIAERLVQASAYVERMAAIDQRYSHCAQLLSEIQGMTDELSREMNKANSDLSLPDAETAQLAESYLVEAQRLTRKHKQVSPLALLEYVQTLRTELSRYEKLDVQSCQQVVDAALQAWRKHAARLSKSRGKAASKLADNVINSLKKLGMPHARFAVELVPEDALTSHGQEDVDFKFASSAKGLLNDLTVAASGGELSRAFLALFTSVENSDNRDLVFDEVDAGIGGKIAAQVGTQLASLGRGRLVMCVTHLPQVAAAAQHHWQVSADSSGYGKFSQVTGAAREQEIARMLAGHEVTKASLANARDIIATATA